MIGIIIFISLYIIAKGHGIKEALATGIIFMILSVFSMGLASGFLVSSTIWLMYCSANNHFI